VGATALSSLGHDADSLIYRGYRIEDLAEQAGFEEVAYLLLRGQLPTGAELQAYQERLRDLRDIPEPVREVLERIPDTGDPLVAMDVLRTAVSLLGILEPEASSVNDFDTVDRLIALLPGLLASWFHFVSRGTRIDPQTGEASTAGHLLALLRSESADPLHRRALEVSLILYADLAFNPSTFASRVCAATRADLFSCLVAAVSTLRGPRHGGASVAVLDLLERAPAPQRVQPWIREMLDRRQRIPGFGHALYQRRDPRTAILKTWAQRLDRSVPERSLWPTAEAIERAMAEETRLFANVDFYTACCYRTLGLPPTWFAPLFVCARIAGWSAHVAEQRADAALIHPIAAYTGLEPRVFVPLADRGPAE
jgi:2-methylcitrate synthase